jgi:hypothetical protein
MTRKLQLGYACCLVPLLVHLYIKGKFDYTNQERFAINDYLLCYKIWGVSVYATHVGPHKPRCNHSSSHVDHYIKDELDFSVLILYS